MIKVLESQPRDPWFKTTGWLQGQLKHSPFRGRSVEYLELLGTER